MKNFMSAMAKVVDGSDPQALARAGDTGFYPKFVRIYRNNSVCALSDVLAANYMSVADIVGEDYFGVLVIDHIKKYPARQRTLVGYGEGFEKTVIAHKQKHRLPYLADFARLDRAWTLAHVAADATPMAIEDLAAMAGAGVDLETVPLTLMPGVSLLKLDWPIFDLWQKIRNDEPLGETMGETIDIEKRENFALVWRYDSTVTYRSLTPLEYEFLLALSRGDTLGGAINSLIINPANKASEDDLQTLLPNAVGADLFVADKRTY